MTAGYLLLLSLTAFHCIHVFISSELVITPLHADPTQTTIPAHPLRVIDDVHQCSASTSNFSVRITCRERRGGTLSAESSLSHDNSSSQSLTLYRLQTEECDLLSRLPAGGSVEDEARSPDQSGSVVRGGEEV